MPAGVRILHKKKAGAFAGGELLAGEFGVDTTNQLVYYSRDGTTVNLLQSALNTMFLHPINTIGASRTLNSGYGFYFVGPFEIEATRTLEILGTARMEIG